MDVFSPEKRSQVMACIRGSRNQSTEEKLRLLFKAEGIIGWRRKFKLPGKPDFVFPAIRVALFVDGCFWHGCPHCFVAPKSNQEYWGPKLQRNRARDRKVTKTLKNKNWRVVRIWEHEFQKLPRLLLKLERHLVSASEKSLKADR